SQMQSTAIRDQWLSEGSLQLILEHADQRPKPILQVLTARPLPNHRVRVALSDGETISQLCLLIGAETYSLFNRNQLERFTVVRLDHYELADIDQGRVILIHQLSVIKPGSEVGRSLARGENFVTGG